MSAVEGRWTLAPVEGDSSRALQVTATNPDVLYGDPVPVVPVDDAAVERAAIELRSMLGDVGLNFRELAAMALRAAGETP